jgi:hypothetical protein
MIVGIIQILKGLKKFKSWVLAEGIPNDLGIGCLIGFIRISFVIICLIFIILIILEI